VPSTHGLLFYPEDAGTRFLQDVSTSLPTMWCNIHGYTVHQRYQTIYSPTNAHNVKNVELLKQYKIKEAAPTYFGLQGNHHLGDRAST